MNPKQTFCSRTEADTGGFLPAGNSIFMIGAPIA